MEKSILRGGAAHPEATRRVERGGRPPLPTRHIHPLSEAPRRRRCAPGGESKAFVYLFHTAYLALPMPLKFLHWGGFLPHKTRPGSLVIITQDRAP